METTKSTLYRIESSKYIPDVYLEIEANGYHDALTKILDDEIKDIKYIGYIQRKFIYQNIDTKELFIVQKI